MVRVQTELDQNRRDADGIIKFSGKVTFWLTKEVASGGERPDVTEKTGSSGPVPPPPNLAALRLAAC